MEEILIITAIGDRVSLGCEAPWIVGLRLRALIARYPLAKLSEIHHPNAKLGELTTTYQLELRTEEDL